MSSPKNAKLINKGDLNNDGAEDFSVYTDFGSLGTINTFIYNRDFPWRVSLRINMKKGEKVSDEDTANHLTLISSFMDCLTSPFSIV